MALTSTSMPTAALEQSVGTMVGSAPQNGLVQPVNFHTVVPGRLYRSGLPEPKDLPFLEGLNLRMVITLVKTEFSDAYEKWMKARGIINHRIVLTPNKSHDKKAMEVARVQDIIRQLLLNPSHYPILVHCNQGRHRTGCVIACFKKVLIGASASITFSPGFAVPSTVEQLVTEYRKFAHDKPREDDAAFIRAFDTSAATKLLQSAAAEGKKFAL